MATPKVLIIMADYGHEPTEATVPYVAFKDAGFDVKFATENGKAPECDKLLIEGLGQKLLGAKKTVVQDYAKMIASEECQHPLSWSAPDFSLDPFSLVFIPGGHDKAVQQIIDSTVVHALLADYFPKTRKPDGVKAIGAICHGVLVLANAKGADDHSVISDCCTTTLPARFEQVAYWGTRMFLGDYYKTYGHGSENVEHSVRKILKDPAKQYRNSIGLSSFVVEDDQYNYISARFPGDTVEMARKMIDLVKSFS
ncbi:class I glutamine amidotransferase-like protein [Dactylonectria macrodidyma]|uniref:Class I glutamine amidotransferase-like protein n=1 Tax=Dactylonectria macrodidyma TaxID=307937 RepID=A0A9P9EF84_9HYPO|nr:class I glutamine amidotransferase-like protein [Dactylonectria macrodidyma]